MLLNASMLMRYDRRTVAALATLPPLRPILHHLEPLLSQNVSKEVRKDALVFHAAVQAVRDATVPNAAVVGRLLDAGRRIDEEFLKRAGTFPVRIVIRYEEVLPLRYRRVEALLRAACRILSARSLHPGLLAAIRAEYAQTEFERALSENFALYASEARMLSRTVRLPLLLVPLRELAAQRLSEVMNDVGSRLSRDVALRIYSS